MRATSDGGQADHLKDGSHLPDVRPLMAMAGDLVTFARGCHSTNLCCRLQGFLACGERQPARMHSCPDSWPSHSGRGFCHNPPSKGNLRSAYSNFALLTHHLFLPVRPLTLFLAFRTLSDLGAFGTTAVGGSAASAAGAHRRRVPAHGCGRAGGGWSKHPLA